MTKAPQALRPYQNDCITANDLDWASGHKSILNSLATGLGKTTILSEQVRRNINVAEQRTLVLAHTREIIYQLKERLENQNDKLQYWYTDKKYGLVPGIGVVMGDKDDPSARIVVATWQSLHEKRFQRVIDEGGVFNRIVYDEAHHVSPDNNSYNLLEAAKKLTSDLSIVGYTATPKRTDGKALGAMFEKISFSYGILDGISGGYLVPATRMVVKTGIDLSGVGKSKKRGDYKEGELATVLEATNWAELAFEAYVKHLGSRQTLAFFPTVGMSRRFTALCLERGINAAFVDFETSASDREAIIRKYQRGDLAVIANYNVFTEGFDAPGTSGILDARPTNSETVKTQMWGRGLRLAPNKRDCLILSLAADDTTVLDHGTLLGKQRTCRYCTAEYYVGFRCCPMCGMPTSTPREDELLPPEDNGGERVIMQKRGVMDGLVEEVQSIFSNTFAAWHKGQDEYLSVGLQFAVGAMVIAPPTWNTDKATRLRARLTNGIKALATIPADDTARREHVLDGLDALRRELDRLEHYTLWFVPKDYRYGIEYLRANSDLAALIIEADSEILRKAGKEGKNQVSKNADWRKRPVTVPQISFARQLRIEVTEDMTQGELSPLMTHKVYVRRVVEFIASDVLAEVVAA